MATLLDSQTRRPTPNASDPVRLESAHHTLVLLRLIAAVATLVIVCASAVVLWLAPWPVDALAAVATAVAWTSWIDRQEQL